MFSLDTFILMRNIYFYKNNFIYFFFRKCNERHFDGWWQEKVEVEVVADDDEEEFEYDDQDQIFSQIVPMQDS